MILSEISKCLCTFWRSLCTWRKGWAPSHTGCATLPAHPSFCTPHSVNVQEEQERGRWGCLPSAVVKNTSSGRPYLALSSPLRSFCPHHLPPSFHYNCKWSYLSTHFLHPLWTILFTSTETSSPLAPCLALSQLLPGIYKMSSVYLLNYRNSWIQLTAIYRTLSIRKRTCCLLFLPYKLWRKCSKRLMRTRMGSLRVKYLAHLSTARKS